MWEISASTGSLNINLTFEHRRASQSSGDSNLMLHACMCYEQIIYFIILLSTHSIMYANAN